MPEVALEWDGGFEDVLPAGLGQALGKEALKLFHSALTVCGPLLLPEC